MAATVYQLIMVSQRFFIKHHYRRFHWSPRIKSEYRYVLNVPLSGVAGDDITSFENWHCFWLARKTPRPLSRLKPLASVILSSIRGIFRRFFGQVFDFRKSPRRSWYPVLSLWALVIHHYAAKEMSHNYSSCFYPPSSQRRYHPTNETKTFMSLLFIIIMILNFIERRHEPYTTAIKVLGIETQYEPIFFHILRIYVMGVVKHFQHFGKNSRMKDSQGLF